MKRGELIGWIIASVCGAITAVVEWRRDRENEIKLRERIARLEGRLDRDPTG